MNRVILPLLTGLTLAIATTGAIAQSPAPAPTTDKPTTSQSRPGKHSPPDQRGHRRFAPLSPREVETTLDMLQRVDPKTAKSLQRRYEQDPQGVSRLIQKRFPRIRSFLAMQRWDPQGFDLRVEDMRLTQQTRSLVRAYRQAITDHDDLLAEQTRQAIEDNLAQRYDLRQQIQQHELDRLEQRMDQIRQRLLADDAQREQHIQNRINELLTPQPSKSPETSPLQSAQPRQPAPHPSRHTP